ncbi:AEC family transporter [Priestia filamentosa]|uniref:AEC family transporter n=1 Tax=Priestia filamentosa TaxID=1402861 RepID=UPI0039827D06
MSIENLFILLLPVFFVILVGYLAGYFKFLSADNAKGLTTFVTKFALPAHLFVGIVTTSRDKLLEELPFFIVMTVGMLGFFLIVMIVSSFFFKKNLTRSAIYGLNSTQPSFAFIGIPVLGGIFGAAAVTVPIAITGIVVNAFLIPAATLIGAVGNNKSGNEKLSTIIGRSLKKGISSPLAFVPFIALILAIFGVHFSGTFTGMFDMIGDTVSGVALFAIGATVGIKKFSLNTKAIGISFLKIVIHPLFMLAVALIFGLSNSEAIMAVLLVSFSCSSVAVMVSAEFKELEKETASAFVISTIFSLLTIPLFIALLSRLLG